ncbi:MAG: PepSY domain-containing protein [Xanthobacteraceae bacterium]
MRAAKKRMPGAVVRARLCRGKEGLVYVLTILARDGKVARLTVDAAKGTVVGRR